MLDDAVDIPRAYRKSMLGSSIEQAIVNRVSHTILDVGVTSPVPNLVRFDDFFDVYGNISQHIRRSAIAIQNLPKRAIVGWGVRAMSEVGRDYQRAGLRPRADRGFPRLLDTPSPNSPAASTESTPPPSEKASVQINTSDISWKGGNIAKLSIIAVIARRRMRDIDHRHG